MRSKRLLSTTSNYELYIRISFLCRMNHTENIRRCNLSHSSPSFYEFGAEQSPRSDRILVKEYRYLLDISKTTVSISKNLWFLNGCLLVWPFVWLSPIFPFKRHPYFLKDLNFIMSLKSKFKQTFKYNSQTRSYKPIELSLFFDKWRKWIRYEGIMLRKAKPLYESWIRKSVSLQSSSTYVCMLFECSFRLILLILLGKKI